MSGTRVYLEQGRTWTFARRAVPELEVGELHVVGAVLGNGTTEFGAPDVRGAVRAGAPDACHPLPYVVRTSAWHVLDHAWEIEDKSCG